MAYLWSNPNPQGRTAAELTSGTQIAPINIAGLVSAILENKHRQAQQHQQDINNISAGISSIGQAYQGNQADDLANRAQYQAQYPNDPYTGQPGYDERVPDYGGTKGLQTQRIAQQLQDEQAKRELNPLHRQYLEAQIDNLNERTANGGLTAGQRAIQDRFETRQSIAELDKELKDAKAGYTSLGIPAELLTSTTGVHSGKDTTGADIPEGNYRLDVPARGNVAASTKDINASEFDKAHAAYDKYQQLLEKRSQVGSEPTSGERTYSAKEQQAAAWAYAHKDDMRSQAILQRLGLQ